MLNENIRIPGCPSDIDLCPLETLKEVFKKNIHECFYDEWCQNKEYQNVHDDYIRQKKEKLVVNVLDDDYEEWCSVTWLGWCE